MLKNNINNKMKKKNSNQRTNKELLNLNMKNKYTNFKKNSKE